MLVALLLLTALAAPAGAPITQLVGLSLPARHARARWVRLAGPLWGPAGPSPDDVFQGHLEDCALLARMAGLAARSPDALRRGIVERPDGSFEVTLYPGGGSVPVRVVVDRLVPAEGEALLFAGQEPADFVASGLRGPASANTRPIWPAVLEKAVAALHGGYAALDGESFEQRAELDGSGEVTLWLPKRGAALGETVLREALRRGAAVELGNADPALAAAAGLKPAHGYAVLSLRTEGGRTLLRLRNPTGAPAAPAAGRPGEVELELGRALATFRFMGVSGPDLAWARALVGQG